MVNLLWLGMILSGVITAAFTGRIDQVSQAIFEGTTTSVQIIISLIGPMALWMGLMNIASESGLIERLGRLIQPMIRFIFPDIPKDHPAAASIMMNLTANLLGLGNSATPLGIKAMQDLHDLNKDSERATYPMCTLLALNTSSLTLVPATIISLRVASGSGSPSLILLSTLFATSFSTLTALICDRTFRLFSQE
ncbi:MAG: nucleoside recognition protein [Halanaerobiales bacterium]|nr:nucleoside recognition protein [Halanaerobiales bacterium]